MLWGCLFFFSLHLQIWGEGGKRELSPSLGWHQCERCPMTCKGLAAWINYPLLIKRSNSGLRFLKVSPNGEADPGEHCFSACKQHSQRPHLSLHNLSQLLLPCVMEEWREASSRPGVTHSVYTPPLSPLDCQGAAFCDTVIAVLLPVVFPKIGDSPNCFVNHKQLGRTPPCGPWTKFNQKIALVICILLNMHFKHIPFMLFKWKCVRAMHLKSREKK